MENKDMRNRSISFMSLLGLVFITLKLCNVINWSWWLVTLPLWFGFGVIAFVSFMILFVVILFSLFK